MVIFIKDFLSMERGKIHQEKLNIYGRKGQFILGVGQKDFKMGKVN